MSISSVFLFLEGFLTDFWSTPQHHPHHSGHTPVVLHVVKMTKVFMISFVFSFFVLTRGNPVKTFHLQPISVWMYRVPNAQQACMAHGRDVM